MNLGMIFCVLAAILFFLAGIAATLIPNPLTWGLFTLTLGFLLGGYSYPLRKT